MKIDLVPDRVEPRADPVKTGVGVFAHLTPSDASDAELKRLIPEKVAPQPAKLQGMKGALRRFLNPRRLNRSRDK